MSEWHGPPRDVGMHEMSGVSWRSAAMVCLCVCFPKRRPTMRTRARTQTPLCVHALRNPACARPLTRFYSCFLCSLFRVPVDFLHKMLESKF